MRILGIETSCDETGVAIYDSNDNVILAEQLFSQASKHARYGGVVPELASRDRKPNCTTESVPVVRIITHKSFFPDTFKN